MRDTLYDRGAANDEEPMLSRRQRFALTLVVELLVALGVVGVGTSLVLRHVSPAHAAFCSEAK